MAEEEFIQDELMKYIKVEDYKKMLEFCCEPKTWKEMSQLKISGDKFKILKDLKIVNALRFADGKYFTAKSIRSYL